ncbi:hypothetical protein [Streptomyces hokutonensis]|uniref:hypothetical protein n=1 Tax=Streptomyces hokutonensis TaxID=1306990 RepID=UPI00036814F5
MSVARALRRIWVKEAPSAPEGRRTSASHKWLPVVQSTFQRIPVRGSVELPSANGSSVAVHHMRWRPPL